jgi:hypothetical protein
MAEPKDRAGVGGTASPAASADERFWKRYSPNHELQLSSLSSIVVHGIAIGAVVCGGLLAVHLGNGYGNRPITMETVEPSTSSDHPGSAPGSPRGEAGATSLLQMPSAPASGDVTLKESRPKGPELPRPSEAPGGRIIREAHDAAELANAAAVAVHDKVNKDLEASAERSPGRPGEPGAPLGPNGSMRVRIERAKRWQVHFTVHDAEDHLQQFAGLGAILAFPGPDGGYRVFRDLSRRRPVGTVEDLSTIHRIWFVDERPETIRGIARLLGIEPPPLLIAFFPESLEREMAELERGQQGKGPRRDQIIFQVVRRQDGRYGVMLADPLR